MPQPITTPINISNIPRKTKIAIIREEYISITGRYEQALILNQFIYWTERVYDFDKFIIEENARKDNHGLQEEMQELTHGWIYKTAAQLADELMTGWSVSTTRIHLKKLIETGFIEERVNPKYKWNQTRQYRVNLNAVEDALLVQGYSIPNFTVTKAAISKIENQKLKIKLENLEIKNVNITETNSEIKNNDDKPVTKSTCLTSTTSPSSSALAPVLVSLEAAGSIYAWIINDSAINIDGRLSVRLLSQDGLSTLKELQKTVSVA
ncbi:MAG: helix-turn-helix transcriptional regulator, partial [Desulfamplus sp.]|nr:helix-turn-helix transcriptional regulator [Desulfamplus sp.]